MGGYKGEGKHTYKSKLLVTSHVRKMVVVVVVVVVCFVLVVVPFFLTIYVILMLLIILPLLLVLLFLLIIILLFLFILFLIRFLARHAPLSQSSRCPPVVCGHYPLTEAARMNIVSAIATLRRHGTTGRRMWTHGGQSARATNVDT